MILNSGTWEVRFCVANVYMNCLGETTVSFYAYQNNNYGLHLVSDINDENILWYDTEAEAKKHILNSWECILSKGRTIKKEGIQE